MDSTIINVEKGVCPICKTESDNYDPVTGMFLCGKCGELFESGEVQTSKKKKRKKDKDEDMEEEDADDESNGYVDEDLNFFTCVILSIGMLIPVVNLVFAYMLGSSYVRREYQKSIMSFFLVILAIQMTVIYLAAFKLKDYGIKSLQSSIDAISQNIATDWSIHRLHSMEFKTIEVSIGDILSSIEPIISDDNTEEELKMVEEDFQYIEDSVQSGTIVQHLIEKYSELDISILMRTKEMEARYGELYRNFGVLLEGSEKNSNGNYFVDYKIYNSYWLDDYDETKSVGFDDLFNTKYIFHIKQNSRYLVELIRDKDKVLLGIKITEVEVK